PHALRLALCDPRRPAYRSPGTLAVDDAARRALLEVLARSPATVNDAATALAARVPVAQVDPSPLVGVVATDRAQREQARHRVAAVDEDDVRLRSAVKTRDSAFTTFLVAPYSRYAARWCAGHGLTPNQVTAASLAVALLAAGVCATGTRAGYVTGALLLQVSFVLDCVDGQLARYTLRFSTVGAWLDAVFDRVKEYAVFAGLAIGSARAGEPVWTLAATAVAFQTVRHMLHFGYTEASCRVDGRTTGPPVLRLLDDRAPWAVWVRRLAILPIGERWALISLTTAVFRPRVVFLVMLAAGTFALAYAAAGRVVRSVRRDRPWSVEGARGLDPMTDLGPLSRPVAVAARRTPALAARLRVPGVLAAATGVAPLLAALAALGRVSPWWLVAAALWYAACIAVAVSRRLTGRLDWLVPALARTAEYATILAVPSVLAPSATPAALAAVAACAYRHYDTVYRLPVLTVPDRALALLAGGHELRVVAVALAAALAPGSLDTVLLVLAALTASTAVAASLRWLRAATRSHTTTLGTTEPDTMEALA
ncbi:MAG: DUF5941 domain-containing protein, partial [Actinomycetota bacterium]|nr:DUF5941 domain-containing protein [Actinomycetota bacterium]